MKNALIVASVASMIDQFNMPNIKLLQNMGYNVDIACNFSFGNTTSNDRIEEFKQSLTKLNISFFNVLFPRKIHMLFQLFTSYKHLSKILTNTNYKIVHCHSPIGGVLTRLACKKYRKSGLRVVYTAHGFHFYNGASIINWLLFYPIEKFLSKYTDIMLTINNEDFSFAKNRFTKTNVLLLPGIGINTKNFDQVIINPRKKRNEIGIPEDAIVLFSVGELNRNKNHEVIITAISKLIDLNIHYIIAGTGSLENELKQKSATLVIENKVHLLGYRRDIQELLKIADVFCFPSFREGLPISVLEAMASGLPLVASNIRGVNDCCKDNVNGILCSPNDVEGFSNGIYSLVTNKEKRINMGNASRELVKKFDIQNVNKIMEGIYTNL